MQNQNANLDVQADLEGNSENEKLCKIEPTTAEAEALSKGLQVSCYHISFLFLICLIVLFTVTLIFLRL